MENVVNGLSAGGAGALILLIAIILFGFYKIITDVMAKNDYREKRYNDTISENQKIINKAVNVIQKDVEDLKEDMKVIKEKVI